MWRRMPSRSANTARSSSIRGGQFENPEGSSRSRNVVLEFKDYATALACYNSPEYQAAIKLRTPHSVGDIVIIEGYDGAQPGDS